MIRLIGLLPYVPYPSLLNRRFPPALLALVSDAVSGSGILMLPSGTRRTGRGPPRRRQRAPSPLQWTVLEGAPRVRMMDGRFSARGSWCSFGIGSVRSVASVDVTMAIAPETAPVPVEVCVVTVPHSDAHQSLTGLRQLSYAKLDYALDVPGGR